MSGGHFNDCGYVYYRLSQFADELEEDIEKARAKGWSKETLKRCEAYPGLLRVVSELMLNFDYLWSGDRGDDRFIACHDKAEAILKAFLRDLP